MLYENSVALQLYLLNNPEEVVHEFVAKKGRHIQFTLKLNVGMLLQLMKRQFM